MADDAVSGTSEAPNVATQRADGFIPWQDDGPTLTDGKERYGSLLTLR